MNMWPSVGIMLNRPGRIKPESKGRITFCPKVIASVRLLKTLSFVREQGEFSFRFRFVLALLFYSPIV